MGLQLHLLLNHFPVVGILLSVFMLMYVGFKKGGDSKGANSKGADSKGADSKGADSKGADSKEGSSKAGVKQTAMLLLLISCITTIPVYVTGGKAEQALLEGRGDKLISEGVRYERIEEHKELATIGYISSLVLGLLSLLVLIKYRDISKGEIPDLVIRAVILLSLLVSVLIYYIGYMGLTIKHDILY